MHRSPRLRRAGSAESPSALLLAVLLSLHAAAPPARAADPDAEPPPEPAHQVGPVTVTATRAEREVLEVPGNVTVIDREEIEQSGLRDVTDLLQREAGLSLTRLTASPKPRRHHAANVPRDESNASSRATARPRAMPTRPSRPEPRTWPSPQATVTAVMRVRDQPRALAMTTKGR